MSGGWSGQILTSRALDRLKEAKNITRLPIISVGGIMTVEDARARMAAGASGIQIYTGWVYGGPLFPLRVLRALKKR